MEAVFFRKRGAIIGYGQGRVHFGAPKLKMPYKNFDVLSISSPVHKQVLKNGLINMVEQKRQLQL